MATATGNELKFHIQQWIKYSYVFLFLCFQALLMTSPSIAVLSVTTAKTSQSTAVPSVTTPKTSQSTAVPSVTTPKTSQSTEVPSVTTSKTSPIIAVPSVTTAKTSQSTAFSSVTTPKTSQSVQDQSTTVTSPIPAATGSIPDTTSSLGARLEINSTAFAVPESRRLPITLTRFQCQGQDNPLPKLTPDLPSNTPCGGCFSVVPCYKDYWCFRLDPSFGLLNMAKRKVYTFTLTCADEKQTLQVHLVRTTSPPSLTLPPSIVLVETKKKAVTLEKINCTDPDGGTVAVDVTKVTPDRAPCHKCFTVLPCGSDSSQCLKYIPYKKLNARNVPVYVVTLTCTDSDGLSVTKTVKVKILPNSPPVFNSNMRSVNISIKSPLRAGSHLYDVKATDINNDTLYYTMKMKPDNDYFQIGYTDGIIRSKMDPSKACYYTASFNFEVFVHDNFNPPVGPLVVSATLEDFNVPPSITNMGQRIQVPEDTSIDKTLYTIKASDDGLPKRPKSELIYNMIVSPPSMQNFFKINDNGDVSLAKELDYESWRQALLSVSVSDGQCTSEVKRLNIQVTDVNERPKIRPRHVVVSHYEGQIKLRPPWKLTDEDIADTHKYSIIQSTAPGYFTIDPLTGEISSTSIYDFDTLNHSVNLTVNVTDKEGKSDQVTVELHVLDVNDNHPRVVPDGRRTFSVTACDLPGHYVGALKAEDDDSSFGGNNLTLFEATDSGPLSLNSDGRILLNKRMREGETAWITAYVTDQGTYPGPLRSLKPYGIIVAARPCPTTRPPRPPKTTPQHKTVIVVRTTPAPTPAPSTAANLTKIQAIDISRNNWLDDNLPWIMISALLGTFLLGLMLYMCMRYVLPVCFNGCRTCCTRNRVTPVRKLKPKTESKPKPKSEPQPKFKEELKIPPRTPTPPLIVGPQDEALHDFWKEEYNDGDFDTHPERNTKPAAIKDALNPLSYRRDPANLAAPSKKGKT